ncbi:hypothetical protein CE91St44_02540 [Oscillospiraceae bacterium]|nr:hypothetical protein CE91St44_02540 [Oscillospiraceae bacterium]
MNAEMQVDTSRWPERYACLESRMFDTLLLQTAIDPALPERSPLPAAAWEALYHWTQRLYWLLSREPQRLMKELHQDDAYDLQCPGPSHGKPNLRRDMRKSLAAVLKLLRLLWNAADQAAPENGALRLPVDALPTKQQAALLAETGLKYADGHLFEGSWPGMFSALRELTKQPDGFVRFARGYYDAECTGMETLFYCFSGEPAAFERLVGWLRENGFHYWPVLDCSEVHDLESCRIAYAKNIDGKQTPGGFYDRAHIGFSAEFNAQHSFPASYSLTIQNPKQILGGFGALPETVQKFIIAHHARCTGCGFCTQRFKNKAMKPAAITVEYGGGRYSLCPTLNYVYGYRWWGLDDALADGLIAYLGYMDKEFCAL